MRKLFLYFLIFSVFTCMCLGGCATRRIAQDARNYSRAEGTPLSTHPIVRDTTSTVPADSSKTSSITPTVKPVEVPKQGIKALFDRVFGSKTVHNPVHTSATAGMVGKCKKCPITINQVVGTQNNEQTNVAKKGQAATGHATLEAQTKTKGPSATGASTARDQRGVGVNSEIVGDNNTPKISNAPVEALDWKAQLAKSLTSPLGIAISLVVGILFLAYCGPLLLARIKRHTNQDTPPTV